MILVQVEEKAFIILTGQGFNTFINFLRSQFFCYPYQANISSRNYSSPLHEGVFSFLQSYLLGLGLIGQLMHIKI